MKNQLLIYQGKILAKLAKFVNIGSGSTWPGHIALKFNPNFNKEIIKNSNIKVIFIAGTNGKTTTTALLSHLLIRSGKNVIQNDSGANLVNGIASTLLTNSDQLGKIRAEFALFEIDENTLPLLCRQITPDIVILLNLFRDQLDRYGEINTIANNWRKAISRLPSSTHLILNADDPQIAHLGKSSLQKVSYFGLNEKGLKTLDHASDSIYCPVCRRKLIYRKSYYSHLGDWFCPGGDFDHPKNYLSQASYYPLVGLYNHYNTLAALLATRILGINAEGSLSSFKPSYGRQEMLQVGNKKVEIILTKNPSSFNQTIRTVKNLKSKNILMVLNDRIADGTDVSWIWDVDFEHLGKTPNLTISGDRALDLALRLKYADLKPEIKPELADAIRSALKRTPVDETLFILPTYTAMLDVRKLLVGKKIL